MSTQEQRTGKHEVFSSRLTFIAVAVGMAVGTGNIWRFPREVGAWGGGAFLVALLIAFLVWAIPILMAEQYLGSRSRLGTVGAFRDFMGRKFAWMGGFMGFVTIGIMFYYSVVCGWAIRYFVYAVTGTFESGADTEGLWNGFTGTPWQTILFHAIAIVLVGIIIFRGLKRGFEAILKFAIPILFVLLVALAIRAMTLPGASDGLRFLFVPEWDLLGDPELWLRAFSQMAFSTGAGWGLYLTYSVYMRKREDFALNSTTLVAGDFLAATLAGTVVMGTIFALRTQEFALEAVESGNEGLAFIYFAELFGEMPGGTWVFAPIFFLALAMAALSSLIAMMELATRNVEDMGLPRRRAVPWIVLVAFIAGIPSAISLEFLGNQDFVWGVGLLIGGLFAAVAMMKFGVSRAREELDADSDFRVTWWWSGLIRIFPLLFVILMGWWIQQSITVFAPDDWWNPLAELSVATMIGQWLLLAIVMLLLNNWLGRKVAHGPMTTPTGSGSVQPEK
ncbi:sodium-dependent transporter [Actinobacteria bacterium YIM 96077]|uniref:Sodium-dependent transporter n=1 Tax=Phytoactinopolyspora halophila TaxID=1981511 RepID=A0A329QJH4_9ACTN|nr:sodium-dependent transporter [Phytoactinopolyspora halophila]AYY15504.1 sodium-dependent transporter [Actinobacteria bacterium YIM 96077]RAW12474.1 sodium-dependent transporter [Phytoactinopolyspora halophila]